MRSGNHVDKRGRQVQEEVRGKRFCDSVDTAEG